MWLLHVLGIDNVSGRWYGFWSGFGSDLAIVGAVAASGWALARKAVQHHKERLAQAETHHAKHLALLLDHHSGLLHQAERHHQRLLDAVAASAPAPTQVFTAPPGDLTAEQLAQFREAVAAEVKTTKRKPRGM